MKSTTQLCVRTYFSLPPETNTVFLIYCRPNFTPMPIFLPRRLAEVEVLLETPCTIATTHAHSIRELILNQLGAFLVFSVKTVDSNLFTPEEETGVRDWLMKNGLESLNPTSQPTGIGLLLNVSGPFTRSRWCARYWQQLGMFIIPCIRRTNDIERDKWIYSSLPEETPVGAMQLRMGNAKNQ